MFRKPKGLVYALTTAEKSRLQGIDASIALLNALHSSALKTIMEREQIAASEDIVFDPAQMVFIKAPKK